MAMTPSASGADPDPLFPPVHDNDFGSSAELDHIESSYAEDWQPSLLVDEDRVLSSQQQELDGEEDRLYFDGGGDDPLVMPEASDEQGGADTDPDHIKISDAPIAWEDFDFDEDTDDAPTPKASGEDEHPEKPSEPVSQPVGPRDGDEDTEMKDAAEASAVVNNSVTTTQQDEVLNPDVPAVPPAPRRDVAAEIAKLTAEIEEEERRRAEALAKELDSDKDSEDDDDELEDLAVITKRAMERPPVERSTRVLRGPNTSTPASLPKPAPIVIPTVAALQGGKRFQARAAARALADKYMDEPDSEDDEDSDLTPPPTPEPGSQIPRRSSFFRKIYASPDSEARQRWLDMVGSTEGILSTIDRWAKADGPFRAQDFSIVLLISQELRDEGFNLARRQVQSVMSRLDLSDEKSAVAIIAGMIRANEEDFEIHVVTLFAWDPAFLRRLSWNMLTGGESADDDDGPGHETLLEAMELQTLPLHRLLGQWEGGHDPEMSRYYRMLSVHWREVAVFLASVEPDTQTPDRQAMIDWLDRVDAVLTFLNNLIARRNGEGFNLHRGRDRECVRMLQLQIRQQGRTCLQSRPTAGNRLLNHLKRPVPDLADTNSRSRHYITNNTTTSNTATTSYTPIDPSSQRPAGRPQPKRRRQD